MTPQLSSVIVEDLVVFYILFEVMLVVMVVSITSYWYSSRSTYATWMLITYTILGSSAMAIAMLLQYIVYGCTSSPHGMENTACRELSPFLGSPRTMTCVMIQGSRMVPQRQRARYHDTHHSSIQCCSVSHSESLSAS